MNRMRKFFICAIVPACFLFFSHEAMAARYLKILKSNAVVGYKDPTQQSKIISVFGQGEELEISDEHNDWYKVKITYSQGYFLYGWVPKNSSNAQIINKTVQPFSNAKSKEQGPVEEEITSTKSRKSTGLDRSVASDLERSDSEITKMIKVFGGPVYDLYKYGAFQYRFGLSYEVPLAQSLRLGFPLGYQTGEGFSAFQFGVASMYSLYIGSFAVVPKIEAGYEYFFGNSKSFHAGSMGIGAAVEYSIADWLVVGIEPFSARIMVWNSTDSLNKIPLNVRGESLILLRGTW